MEIQIKPAQFPNDAGTVYNLFTQYANSLGIDLTYQQFQSELNSLPGKYTESEGGALLLARINEDDGSNNSNNNNVVGCVALRRSSDTWCEMKRLYVLDEARGTRLGQRLVEAILARAKELGYRGIRLDTLANMVAAQRLYRKYGFREIEAYYETPIQGTVFMGYTFTKGIKVRRTEDSGSDHGARSSISETARTKSLDLSLSHVAKRPTDVREERQSALNRIP